VVDLREDMQLKAAVRRYKASPLLEYADPDFVVKPLHFMTADYLDYSRLWGLDDEDWTAETKTVT
jgi:hypothetical protein